MVRGEPIPLEEKCVTYHIDRTTTAYWTWDDFCREVIWYGNKKGAYLSPTIRWSNRSPASTDELSSAWRHGTARLGNRLWHLGVRRQFRRGRRLRPNGYQVSRAALRCAVEQGINFFDTSDLYGFGHSEEILGETFSTGRDKVVLASKGGFMDAGKQDFSPAHFRQAVEQKSAPPAHGLP